MAIAGFKAGCYDLLNYVGSVPVKKDIDMSIYRYICSTFNYNEVSVDRDSY